MQLTSPQFLIFLTAAFAAWRLAPAAWRHRVLLAASWLFCGLWEPWFVLVLLYCTLLSYAAGRAMGDGQASGVAGRRAEDGGRRTEDGGQGTEDRGRRTEDGGQRAERTEERGRRTEGGRRRKGILAAAVVLNLLPLAFFKYYNFLNESLRGLLAHGGWLHPAAHLDILLPVGISFYTFQAVSYCADVCQGRLGAERGFGRFALYLSFFPRLISGPIERGARLLPQLGNAGALDAALLVSGVQLFAWGAFKKVVIADRLGMYADMVFGDPQAMYGVTAIAGAWMFSLQVYCDFSAYMDMAVGCGRIFGIELSRNFDFPYMARSIGDFWRRWHITLTSWFRDYVYIPLGGNRTAAARWALNVMAVFLLSGLWHGAAWTFVFWGGLHGLFYLGGRISAPLRTRLRRGLGISGRAGAVWQVAVTFHLVTLAWVFFRARTIGDAFHLIGNMFLRLDQPLRMLSSQFSTALAFFFALMFVGLELLQYWAARRNLDLLRAVPPAIRYPGYAAGLLAIALLGVGGEQFIYFQF